jgi:hypothetical protein
LSNFYVIIDKYMTVPASVELGRNPESLSALLRTDEIANRLSSLMHISQRLAVESAFAVYDRGVVSDVIYPDTYTGQHMTLQGNLRIDLSPIIGSELEGTARRDVLLTVHTHPPTNKRPHAKAFPSSNDLNLFDCRSRQTPHMINGVLSWSKDTPVGAPGFSLRGIANGLRALRGGTAALLLTKHNPDEHRRLYDDIFAAPVSRYDPDSETWDYYAQHADNYGVNYAQVTVHPRSGAIIDDSQLPHLFYEGPADVPRGARLA